MMGTPDARSFQQERARPFQELLARIPIPADHVGSILDVGCGTGKHTARLAAHFPHAQVLGLDASERMLMHAPSAPRLKFVEGDLRTWVPDGQFDLVVSHSVLQWIPNPAGTVRRLARWVAPRGCLAIQVPAELESRSDIIVANVARRHGIDPELGIHTMPLDGYRETLEDIGFAVTAWDTTYRQKLAGKDPVLKWLSGTTLRPYVRACPPEIAKAFLAELGPELAAAYPGRDGVVEFPFTRRFVVAQNGP